MKLYKRLIFLLVIVVFTSINSLSIETILCVRVPASVNLEKLNTYDLYTVKTELVKVEYDHKVLRETVMSEEFFSASDPIISPDGKTVFFSGRKTEADRWQIWTMDSDGKNFRQITHSPTHAHSPVFTGVLFHLNDAAPTQKFVFMQSEKDTLPFSHSHLFSASMDGSDVRQISFNPYPEFSPAVMPNGRILYGSEFSSHHSGQFSNLLAINLDGTDLMGYMIESDGRKPMAMPAVSDQGVVGFIEYFSGKYPGGGSFSMTHARRPKYFYNNLNLDSNSIFHSPECLNGDLWIVSVRDSKKSAPYHLKTVSLKSGKIMDTKDNLSDNYHYIFSKVIKPREKIPGRSSFMNYEQETGVLYCLNVYVSEESSIRDLKKGSVKQVRFFRGIKKNGEVVKVELGTAPVEKDGSFHVILPSEIPVCYQLEDVNEHVLEKQKSWTWVKPRESRGCIGCHENRELSPPNRLAVALTKPAVKVVREVTQ